MKLEKIGILTMYNDSINYGGVLQAYALQKYFEINGYNAEQICFKKTKTNIKVSFKKNLKNIGLVSTLLWAFDRIIKKIDNKIAIKIIKKKEKDLFEKRKEKFRDFRNLISHSTEIFDSTNIKKSNELYDIFCCGSDQIWKPGVICPEYLLSFVENTKKKFSYAASISKTNISEEDLKYMLPYLSSFNTVSVREKEDSFKLSRLIDKEVKWVLDPTLLLDIKEYEKICSNENIGEPYIFCYLLENNSKKYEYIKKMAKKSNLKIVTIPFSNGNLNLRERKFGDIRIIDAGPKDFLSLIKNANLVVTDSFHATVFSIIFQTNFYVLERFEEKSMNSRIISLLELFGLMNHFIPNIKDLVSDKNKLDFKCEAFKSIDYLSLKEESKIFINKSIGGD